MARRLTKAEREQIVPDIIRLLDERKYDHQIFAAMKEKYGIARRTAQRYLARARDERIRQTQRGEEDHRVDSYRLYADIASNSEAAASDRIKAQNSIDKLLGLRRPVQTHGTQVTLGISVDELKGMTDDELDAFERRLTGAG